MSSPMSTVPAPESGARREPLLRHLLGGVLREERLRQGRTLVDVAARARVSVAYLSEIERGRKEPSSEVLVAVCGSLGIRLTDLVAATHAALVGSVRPVLVDLASSGNGVTAVPHGAPVPASSGGVVLLAA